MVVAHTARALARTGASVEVLAQERGRALPQVADEGGVIVRRFPATSSAAYPVAPGLWRHLREHQAQYDIVHGHNYHCVAAAGAALALRGRQRPGFVFSPHYHGGGHTALSSLMHRAYRPVGRRAIARAAAVVCVSRAEAELVLDHFPSAASRISVIPNGVDASRLAGAEPWPAQPPTILSVGRLERYKRVDRLVAALRSVPEPTRLVVIGDGPERARLETLTTDLGIAERIRFLGRISDADLARWLRTAQVFCSLSEHEAFGLAPAEALAAGATVVLSDIPAHAELASDGPATLIGPDDNDAHLAAALIRALERGRRDPRPSAPDWDHVAGVLHDVYGRILAAGPGEGR